MLYFAFFFKWVKRLTYLRNAKTKRAKSFEDFDHCVIKRTVHGLCSRKIAPTVSMIHKKIKDSIKISKSKLNLTLIDLGYTKKK